MIGGILSCWNHPFEVRLLHYYNTILLTATNCYTAILLYSNTAILLYF